MCLTVNSWAQNSENVDMLFHWSDSEIPGSWAFDNAYNEIWGYQDGANEYAIIGTTNGTHIFNVTDPASSTEIHFIEGQITGPEIIHRDYHDYEKYLYIACDEGASTLQIVDMSSLPNEVNVVYDSSDLFTRSHNIFIDEDMGVLYSCGGSSTLNLYDLSDPINPTLIIDCDDDVDFWANTVGYVHDIFVRNGIAYCNAGNGLYIVDFTDPSNPVFLGSLTDYTDSGYNHSGYLHEDGQYYALADETHGMRIKILDVSDPTDIIEVSYLWSEVDALSIAHNLIFDGDILHVSYYYDGYYAFDLSDPLNPVVIGYYDTSTIPNDNSYEGAWGVYPFLGSGNILVSDMQEGLFILDLNAVTSVESVTIHNRRPSIFPNPMSNQSEINITGLELDVNFGNYVLLDQLGKTVGSGLINFSKGNAQIELPEIGAGYYHLQVYQDNNLYNFQLVK
jgi:choice-of-anchor B domain-containing protein